MNLKGSLVAIITPMSPDGEIDYRSFADLIEWHIAAKTSGIVVAGTTGESATLEPHEHAELLAFAVKQVAGRVPVIAGTGTNSTRSTLKLMENAKNAKVDACLVVTPYYNKPTQKGLIQHYKVVAQMSDLPIVIYNVPSRTSCDILPETVATLSKIKNIIGIKEATGKRERALEIRKLTNKNFMIYSGDDLTALDLMLDGADGVISVTANVAPAEMAELCAAALNGDHQLAESLQRKLTPLHKELFIESNPTPTKWVLNQMGKIQSGIRLPLLPLDQQYEQRVKEAMQNAGVRECSEVF